MSKAEQFLAVTLLMEAKRLLEASDPPKNEYTRQFIGRLKRFINRIEDGQ